MSMGALVQLSGREAGCLFFCSPFITLMKTVIVCIPPELSSAGEVKKFLRRLSEEIRGFWEPRCPGCGSKRVWRDGAEPRKTAPPAQRYECHLLGLHPLPGGPLLQGRPGGPCGVSHVTVAGMVHGAGTQEDPRGRRRWIGDETFVRVAGKTMYPGSGWWTGGAGLSRGFSPPEGGRPRPRWSSPRRPRDTASPRSSCTTETGYTTEPSGTSTWTGGRESSCTGGSGSPRGRLHHQPPGGGVEPLQVLVRGAQGIQEVGERPALPRAVQRGEEPPGKNTDPTTNPR